MDIQPYIESDKSLLFQWNGSDSLFWDGFMWVATSTYIWIPLGVMLLYVIFKNNIVKEAFLIIIAFALVITLADQIASGICKPLFQRFRPTQDPEMMYLVDVVNNYRAGRYGFISSHAANTFGVAVFVSLLIRHKLLSIILFIWASLNAYSRIYLGVHYPGDILFGTLDGCLIGWGVYVLYKWIQTKWYNPIQYVSNRCTSSGYLLSDVYRLMIIFVLTCIAIVIWGIVQVRILYL